MLNLSRTPNRKRSPFFVVMRFSAARPKSIVKAVYFDNASVRQRLVIGSRLA
jgi:hypothetical protein